MATGTAAPPAVGPEDLATVALADQLEWCRDEMSRLSAENDLLRQLLLQATTFGPRTLAAPPPHPGSEPVGACAACVGSPLPQIGGQESPLPQVQRRRARNSRLGNASPQAWSPEPEPSEMTGVGGVGMIIRRHDGAALPVDGGHLMRITTATPG